MNDVEGFIFFNFYLDADLFLKFLKTNATIIVSFFPLISHFMYQFKPNKFDIAVYIKHQDTNLGFEK